MDKLRDEVLQAQRARSDLLKWKLGLVGVIGAVGLGLSGNHTTRGADLVLCAIPLVCLYVDLLCRHLNLRMIVIGRFLRTRRDPDDYPQADTWAAYEDFTAEVRDVAFVLEGWALTWSTCGVSAFVLIYAFARAHTNTGTMFVFALSGAVGAIFTLIANLLYQRRSEKLRTWRPRAGDRQESPPAG